MPSQLLPGGHFWLLLWFQLKDNLPLLIPRPKIPVTFDSKSMIKKALHPFFLPASPPFAETFRMNPIFYSFEVVLTRFTLLELARIRKCSATSMA